LSPPFGDGASCRALINGVGFRHLVISSLIVQWVLGIPLTYP
jgi:hypothetical protein